jgi:hypothetical protein
MPLCKDIFPNGAQPELLRKIGDKYYRHLLFNSRRAIIVNHLSRGQLIRGNYQLKVSPLIVLKWCGGAQKFLRFRIFAQVSQK